MDGSSGDFLEKAQNLLFYGLSRRVDMEFGQAPRTTNDRQYVQGPEDQSFIEAGTTPGALGRFAASPLVWIAGGLVVLTVIVLVARR